MKSILSGIIIAMSCTVYIVNGGVVGAVLFSFGLLSVVTLGLDLYTGIIGFLFTPSVPKKFKMVKILVGNMIGIFIGATLIRMSGADLCRVSDIVLLKLNKSSLEIICSAILCGAIMYICVVSYKLTKREVSGTLTIILGVTLFILCGFDHSIANLGYLVLNNTYSLDGAIFLSSISRGTQ